MKLKAKIILLYCFCFLVALCAFVSILLFSLRFDLQVVLDSLRVLIAFYVLLGGVGLLWVVFYSGPIVEFIVSLEKDLIITNQQASLAQKRASYLPYFSGGLIGLLIFLASGLNALYLYYFFQIANWQIFTFPLSGLIAALFSSVISFAVMERVMYGIRELADQKNTLPSLKHPGLSLFTKLFIEFGCFALGLVTFISLFMHNSIMYEYQYFRADPQIFERTILSIRTGAFIMVALALVMSYVLAATFSYTSFLALRKLEKYLKAISEGDLTHRLLSGASDEFFSICRSASYMVNSLKLMVLRAKDMGMDLGSAAKKIKSSEEQQAHGAIETARTLANTISTLHNLANSAVHVHETAEKVAGAAQATLATSRLSQEAIERIKEEMGNIKERVAEITRKISGLEDRSRQINNIATMIEEITEQTNLLSVNASIEASRAGEYGKGFSQVAIEIRKLAERAANSTKEIESLIAEIQTETHSTVAQTRQGSASVQKSVEIIQETAQAIEKINLMIADTSEAAQQILTASSEQKISTGEIVGRIQKWSNVAHQFEISTHNLVASTKRLNQLSEELKSAISGFRVEQE